MQKLLQKKVSFCYQHRKRVSNGLTCLWATIEAFPETEQLYPYAVG